MNTNIDYIDSVNAVITIRIEKEDYIPKVNEEIKKMCKKAFEPGFRPGHVPEGLIRRKYEKLLTLEEVENQALKATVDKVREDKLQVLGKFLSYDPNKLLSTDDAIDGAYEIKYRMGLLPDLNVSLSKEDVIDYYVIEVGDAEIDSEIESLLSRYGSHQEIEKGSQIDDFFTGELCELDEAGQTVENGINNERAVLIPSYMKDEEEKQKFDGLSLNDTVIVNPSKAYNGDEREIASFLGLERHHNVTIPPNFSYKVTGINRYVHAQLGQELYDHLCGKDVVTTEKDFRLFVKNYLQRNLLPEQDYRFQEDLLEYLLTRNADKPFPDEFLKEYLFLNQEEGKRESKSEIEANYPETKKSTLRHFIIEKIAEQQQITATEEDLKQAACAHVYGFYSRYGIQGIQDDLISAEAQKLLKDESQREYFSYVVLRKKVTDAAKESVTLCEKSITLEEFKKKNNTVEEEDFDAESEIVKEEQ